MGDVQELTGTCAKCRRANTIKAQPGAAAWRCAGCGSVNYLDPGRQAALVDARKTQRFANRFTVVALSILGLGLLLTVLGAMAGSFH